MGRKYIESGVREVFTYLEESRQSKCLIENCNYIINGNHLGNLKKHVMKKHNEIYIINIRI